MDEAILGLDIGTTPATLRRLGLVEYLDECESGR